MESIARGLVSIGSTAGAIFKITSASTNVLVILARFVMHPSSVSWSDSAGHIIVRIVNPLHRSSHLRPRPKMVDRIILSQERALWI
jgi:hypothetical protein